MSTTLPEMEKPRITEIKVRMDCNGCVQKIKKALHGINGIYDLYIDFPQQKITIIGCTDPQKIAKAIRKTRKTAVICSHSEPFDHDDQPAAQPSEPATADGGPPPPAATEGGAPAAPESPSQPAAEAQPQPESPKESPPPPPPENPPIYEAAATTSTTPQVQTSKPQDIEEIHVIHHHAPPERYGPYGYGGGQWNPRGGAPVGSVRFEPPQPTYVTHSYNDYRPSPYVTEYAYINRPSPPTYSQYYTRPIDQYAYSNEEHRAGSNGNYNITSVFSDENPNACTIA